MKRLFIVIAVLSAVVSAWGIGASQEWVKRYVAALQVKEERVEGGLKFSAGADKTAVSLFVEDATVSALMATNATPAAVSAGVTNGMYFVWHEQSHSYTNHAQAIVAQTNYLAWAGHVTTNAVFDGFFEVKGRKIQPAFAKEVTK